MVRQIKKSKIPKLRENVSLDELFLKKNTLISIGFLFYANGDKLGLTASTSASRAPQNTSFEPASLRNKQDGKSKH